MVEGFHRQYAREDTLVVTVQETTQTGEAGNTKDFGICDQGRWSTCGARKLLATIGRIVIELNISCAAATHLAGIISLFDDLE